MLVLTFQIGNDRLALDIRRVCEVVPRVQLERPASAPEWLAGMFVYRGKVVPVIDLHRLLGAGDCPQHLSSRIILVPVSQDDGRDSMLGLLAAQVADMREIDTSSQTLPRWQAPGRTDLGHTLVHEGRILHLLDLDRLLPQTFRELLPAPPPGSPAS
jgi:chemotaxis-related protein WspB